MIDGHIHYIAHMGAERLEQVIAECGYEAIALQCIPAADGTATEADALRFREQCSVPVYIFGGLPRELYDLPGEQLADALVQAAAERIGQGCTGIKMLEGKPNIRKQFPIPDFDDQVWDAYWTFLEQRQIPVYLHVNDPEEFWDPERVSPFARQAGWFYDDSYLPYREQYRQMEEVLKRHPSLRILFPHFYFLSEHLPELSALLDAYPNVRIDLTPGSELFYNLSERQEEAAAFFQKYQDRICFGSDIGARVLVAEEKKLLSLEECRSRLRLIREFLETKGDYRLRPDGYYITVQDRVMHGLGLEEAILKKIYRDNFLDFIHARFHT